MDGGLIELTRPGPQAEAARPPAAPGMPPQRPREMAEQAVHAVASLRADFRTAAQRRRMAGRRLFVFGGAGLLTGVAAWQMLNVLNLGGLLPVEAVVLAFFTVNFAWIALTFATAIAGCIGLTPQPRPPSLIPDAPIGGRTAVVMPTYNERPDRIFATIETLAAGIERLGESSHFDWFILSDTNDPEVALEEEAALAQIRRRLAGLANVYYRRRRRNTARKAGNVADFCRRWGGAYDYMLVLDADSLMAPATITELVRRMEAHPEAGLIQTVPALINGRTLLARMQQFAGRIYGPVNAAGLAWWAGPEGNYWGHNAIIRMRAFTEAAGLPILPGRPPFGGHVLSHDFVEAAFIRRAGWAVLIADDLPGSYEEGPPSMVDLAARDRRWAQGNLQHSKLIHARGLHWVSRVHLATGIMSYLSSFLWLGLILAGLALALQAYFIQPVYFPGDFQLFPTWPIIDSERAFRLFAFTMAVLFAPKVIGLVSFLVALRPWRSRPGILRLTVSALIETLLSALMAPVFMLIQCGLVISILRGHDSGWKTQERDGGAVPLGTLIRRHWPHMAAGAILAFAAYLDSWRLVAWMSPAIIGMLLAVPLSAASGSVRIGNFLRRRGLITIPEDYDPPPVAVEAAELRRVYSGFVGRSPDLAALATDEGLRRQHNALVDAEPAPRDGTIDHVEAVAAAKIAQANSVQQAIAWMARDERCAVLGTPALMEQLARLPAPPAANAA